jgi:hypothetical protein
VNFFFQNIFTDGLTPKRICEGKRTSVFFRSLYIFALLFTLLPTCLTGQFAPSIGAKMSGVFTGIDDYVALGEVYNAENQTFDYYVIHNEVGPLVGEVCMRGFGRNFLSTKPFLPGYSLEFGFQQFRGDGKFVYLESSTPDPDSIINEYDNFHYKTDYTTVFIRHYLDFNWNLNSDLKWTNSIGVGFRALIRASARDIPNASIFDIDRPVVITVNFETQLTEKYKYFDVGYFISFDMLALNMFKDEPAFDPRIKLKNTKFYGFGLRVIPHPKKKKKYDTSH